MESGNFDQYLGAHTRSDTVEKNAKIKVHVPYREGYRFSPNCILCGSQKAPNKFTVSSTFQSGNYLVARKKTTVKYDGFRICDACKKRTSLSVGESILLIVAILFGGGIFGLMLYAKVFFCVGCFAWVIIAAVIYLVGRLLIPGRAEAPPALLEVRTEGRHIGTNRPIGMIFKFRSRRAADEFSQMNNGEEVA